MDGPQDDLLDTELERVSALFDQFLEQHPAYQGECKIMIKAWIPAPPRTRRRTRSTSFGPIRDSKSVEVLWILRPEEIDPVSTFVGLNAGSLVPKRDFLLESGGIMIYTLSPPYEGKKKSPA